MRSRATGRSDDPARLRHLDAGHGRLHRASRRAHLLHRASSRGSPRRPTRPLGGAAARYRETALAAGDWALESREDLELAGIEVPPSASGLHAVNALHVCRLAEAVEPVEPEQVRPNYVRLPDAEINRRSARDHGTG